MSNEDSNNFEGHFEQNSEEDIEDSKKVKESSDNAFEKIIDYYLTLRNKKILN